MADDVIVTEAEINPTLINPISEKSATYSQSYNQSRGNEMKIVPPRGVVSISSIGGWGLGVLFPFTPSGGWGGGGV